MLKPAAENHRASEDERFFSAWFAVGLLLLFTVSLVLTGLYAFYFAAPFGDTYTYLEPGRNLLRGRGFVTRFNIVHGWSGALDHPGLAYYNPLYGLLLAAVWELFDDPSKAAVIATALPCSVNAVLLALLVRRPFGVLTALLSGVGYLLLPSTWQGLWLIAAEHPAVTVTLLCLLLIQYEVPRRRRAWLLVGAVLGVGCLVKISVGILLFGLPAAIFLAERGSIGRRLRASGRPIAELLIGMAAVLVPYSLYSRVAVGELYPSYPSMAQNWSLATEYGGRYVDGAPAVQPDAERIPSLRARAAIVAGNVATMAQSFWAEIGVLSLAMLLAFVGAEEGARRAAIFLLCAGGSLMLGHAASFNWLPLSSDPSTPARYILYTAACAYPVAIYGLVRTAHWLPRARWRGVAVVALWLASSYAPIGAVIANVREVAAAPRPRVLDLQELMQPAVGLGGADDLVAVGGGDWMICGAVFLDRPVVSMPLRRMNTAQGLRDFIALFQPKVVIPDRNAMSAYGTLVQLGYQLVRRGGPDEIRIYTRDLATPGA